MVRHKRRTPLQGDFQCRLEIWFKIQDLQMGYFYQKKYVLNHLKVIDPKHNLGAIVESFVVDKG